MIKNIPSELGQLSKLEEINVGDNDFRGALPSELGGLAQLKRLGVYGNFLSGDLPSEIANLQNLESMLLCTYILGGPDVRPHVK